jgi:dipeptidyl aminopeptidase/acylaminoacyl peptidase
MMARSIPSRFRLLLAAATLVLATESDACLAQSSGAPLQVDDLLDVLEFTDRTPIALSPDGRLVAFTVTSPRRAAAGGPRGAYFDERSVPRAVRGGDVHVAETRTGRTRRLTDGRGSSWGPVWSADGGRLAFYSDRDGMARIWVWDVAADRLVRISSEVVRPFWGFEQMHWSRDGRQLLVKLMPEGLSRDRLEELYPVIGEAEATSSRVAGPLRFHHPGRRASADGTRAPGATGVDLDSTRSFLNVQLGDLAVVDVATGNVRRIARGVRAIGYRFSPLGERVAFTTRQPNGGSGALAYDRYDLWSVGFDGAPPRLLAGATVQEYGLAFAWSPSGRSIAYASRGAVHVLCEADGVVMHVFPAEGAGAEHDYRPPLWLDDAGLLVARGDTLLRLEIASGAIERAAVVRERRLLEIVAAPEAQRIDGSPVLVKVADPRTKRRGFQRLDLVTGEAHTVYEDDVTLGSIFEIGVSAGGDVAFVSGDATRPPDVWLLTTSSGSTGSGPTRVTDMNPAVAEMALGRSMVVEWTDAEGRELQGALLLPPGLRADVRYPLVVEVYDGRRSGLVNHFGLLGGLYNLHLLASRGYAVLVPDAPVRGGSPMADFAAAILPAIRAVVDLGVADPDRVAVFGHSYGGYGALALAVQAPGLRAVISSGGFSNLHSQYTALRDDGSVVGVGWAERGQGRMGAHPWERPERYVENSPFFFLDRVEAPVLLLHGGADRTVAPRSSRDTFVGLRRLGKVVTLLEYGGEEHSPLLWRMDNLKDFWTQVFDWLELHTGPRQAQDGANRDS